MKESDTMPTTY